VHEHDDLDATRGPARRPPDRVDAGPSVARSAADPRTAGLLELQRLAGNAAVSRAIGREDEEGDGARSPVLDVVGQGGGSPLPSGVREEMEGRLGADFADVRVHADARASDSARAVNAQAYTVGSDVVFREDRWAPDSSEGKRTLAHELTHVVQQRSGPVAGTPVGGGIRLSDPGDEFEQAAEHAADTAMAASLPVGVPQGSAPAAQRQDEEGEEEVQELSAQRQDEEEEEEEEVQELSAQRQETEEPEEQEEESVQGLSAQRQGTEEEEELAAG
jgi:hypothetical protein